MISNRLLDALKSKLHPMPYGRDVDTAGSFDLLLMRNSALPGGRYAFAVRPIGTQDAAEACRLARADARRLTNAIWLIREVGLYLVLHGPESTWKDQAINSTADRTGFHHIIVQAVHFVDPETGANHLNQSAWGPVKFGGLIPIPQLVEEVIQDTYA